MKVVLDTNVLVAGLGFPGICRAVTDVCIDGHTLMLSEHILAETHRNLVEKLNHPPEAATQRVALLREAATLVEPAEVPADGCRDPDDLPVLGTLLAGKGDCLVTGDNDLLTLETFAGRPILSPRQFWQGLR